jgi:Flp pilus assembly protein TadG
MLLNQRRRGKQRRAAAAVEFAVIAPLMMLLTFGLVEIGRIMLVKQTAIHATREGARLAIHPNAKDAEIFARVNQELALLGISDATVEMEPSSLELAEPGSAVTVRVRMDLQAISVVPGLFNFAAGDIVAESSMRRESTE